MVAVADFSRLVSSIYEAAVTPQHWELAIRDIQCALGGTGGALLQGEGSVWSFHDYTIPAAAMQSYTDHYHRSDYVLAAMRTADVGLVQTGPQVVVPNRDPEFYADWMRPNELEDGLFVRLTGEPQPTCFVIASSKVGFDSADRVALFSICSRRCERRTGSHRWRTVSSRWPERSRSCGTESWWWRAKAWW